MKQQSNISEINSKVWGKLIEALKPHQDNCLECVSLKGKHGKYKISFYAWSQDDYELKVENFGMEQETGWVQFEPNDDQLKSMGVSIAKEVERLEDIQYDLELEIIQYGGPDNFKFHVNTKKTHHEQI